MGEPELWERVGGVDIAFTPASFGQANTQVVIFLPGFMNINTVHLYSVC